MAVGGRGMEDEVALLCAVGRPEVGGDDEEGVVDLGLIEWIVVFV
jgi:hypothetical protein